MAVVGFDFGTTNSVVSVVQGEGAINFLDEGAPTPSVVCYEGSQVIAGRPAKERLAEAGLGVKGNVVRSPKTLLGREGVFVGGVQRSPVDMVRDVVAHVRERAMLHPSAQGLKMERAVVTIPINMEGRRRAELRDAFRMAGMTVVQFVHEPLSALYGYLRRREDMATALRQFDRQLMLVVDWGGGTLDLTLCRLVDGLLVQEINDGTDDVGGDVFDNVLRNEIERRVRQERQLPETTEIRPDALQRLVHRCERAKIDLSTRSRAEIYVPNFYKLPGDPDLSFGLERDQLEAITAELLQKGIARIHQILAARDLSPASIALCLATGGMVNMPAIKTRLHEIFGPQRVHISDRSATLIAEGAAWVAHDQARLHLAKNVELLLARNSQLPLISAGTEMPQVGEVCRSNFSLYCVDPRDGLAKFQLQSPVRPGRKVLAADRRIPLETLVIPVDRKAHPFTERLELEVDIDENLVLKASANSYDKNSRVSVEVHSLEFGLALRRNENAWGEHGVEIDVAEDEVAHEQGALQIRANVTHSKDDFGLVPGELLYMVDPQYFNKIKERATAVQEAERLYYVPCAGCRLASNDPRCQCAKLLPFDEPGLPYDTYVFRTDPSYRPVPVRRTYSGARAKTR